MTTSNLLVASRLAAHGIVVDFDQIGSVSSWNFEGPLYPACLMLDADSGQLMLRSGPVTDFMDDEAIDAALKCWMYMDANQLLADGRFSGWEAISFEKSVALTGDRDNDVKLIDGLLGLADLNVCTDAFDAAEAIA